MKFRRKPAIVDAMRVNLNNLEELSEFTGAKVSSIAKNKYSVGLDFQGHIIQVCTAMMAIKDNSGDVCFMDTPRFQKSYEEVDG